MSQSQTRLILQRLLQLAGGAQDRGYLLVAEGAGIDDLPSDLTSGNQRYLIHRVQTELGLRHLLWKARGAPLIAILPEALAGRLREAPDLLRRAQNQRVHALSANDVVELVLGVRVVGADTPFLSRLALEHVKELEHELGRRTLPTVIDRRLLTELLVDVSVGHELRNRQPGDLLATWAQEPPNWSEELMRLVREALPTLQGDEGAVLAWALAEPASRLHLLLVHGALLSVEEEELPRSAWGPLWKATNEEPLATFKMGRRILRRTVSRLVEESLNFLSQGALRFLDEAGRVGRETLTPAQLQSSPVLPLAFENRCHALAQRAAKGEAIESHEVEALAAHKAAPLFASDMEVIKAMARLSRYLQETPNDTSSLLDRVRAYQRHGAFADLAVQHLRRQLASTEHFHTEAQALCDAVRERRDCDNLAFAEQLADGYESAVHRDVTPLHRVWRKVVQESLWNHDAHAKVFLVVLDGCSYPVFLELLRALSQDATFPIGLDPDNEGSVIGLPGLAPLPTVTSHARGALFLGQLPNDPLVAETVFRGSNEAKTDKARFKQNVDLGDRSRKLFLKGDLGDGGRALLAELRGRAVDVIAVVFNAVDDQIESSNTGAPLRLAPEDIVAFKPSLRVALEEGWRVLLTADHGHTLFVDKDLYRGKGSGRRFLHLTDDDRPPEGFLEIDLAGLGGPPERRAFAWRSGVYLGHPKVGFHGGCALEEMVIPLAWLERGGLSADEPSWWYGSRTLPKVPSIKQLITPPLDTPPPDTPPSAPDPSQLSLFDPADRADTLPLSADLLARLSDDQKAVLVLLQEVRTARASDLAKRLSKNPLRLNGMLRRLGQTLHKEGQGLFNAETLPDGETQYHYQPEED